MPRPLWHCSAERADFVRALRIVLLLALELAVLFVLLVAIGSVVIPLAAPRGALPTPTTVPGP